MATTEEEKKKTEVASARNGVKQDQEEILRKKKATKRTVRKGEGNIKDIAGNVVRRAREGRRMKRRTSGAGSDAPKRRRCKRSGCKRRSRGDKDEIEKMKR